MGITRRSFLKTMGATAAMASVPGIAIASAKEKKTLFSLIDSIIAEGENVLDIHVEIRKDGHMVKYRDRGVNGGYQLVPSRYQMASENLVTRQLEAELGLQEGKLSSANRYMVNMDVDGLRIATMPAYPEGMDLVMRVTPRFPGIFQSAKTYKPTMMI